MDTNDAYRMATHLLMDYELDGWTFSFDNATARFGHCMFGTKRITISRVLTELNTEAEVRNTILHEIAHALVGPGHNHDRVWAAMAKAIGGSADRTHNAVTPPERYVAHCPGCGRKVERSRLVKRPLACSDCCRKHNGGKFSVKYVFEWKDTRARV